MNEVESTVKELAVRIDKYSYENDYYNYMDYVDSRDENIENIAFDLKSGNTGYMISYLNEIINEKSDTEDGLKEANFLINEINNYRKE